MANFEGFYPESIEVLLGIRFNNNKEWFQAHKEEYKKYVQEPIAALAENLYQKMQETYPDFKDEPRICRANRDIRFSKNKAPYKDHKWFFLGGKNTAVRNPIRPNYVFEIMPEGYIYGLGFWPGPKGMATLRKNMDDHPEKIKKLIRQINQQDVFCLEGDSYKNKHYHDPEDDINNWYVKKDIALIHHSDIDDLLYQSALLLKVYEGFKYLYPLYEYFSNIAD